MKMKEKRSKIREKLSLRAVGLILAMSMVAGTLLPVGVGAEELPIDINNEEITVADVMMYEDTDMSEDEEENEAAAENEEVIDVVSEENSEEAPAETSEPEAAEPETTESEVSESEVSEPEVTEPEVPDFEETEPDEIITEEELPADAPEEEIYFCGIEEHEHTEECRNAPEEPDGEIIAEEEIPEEEPQPEEEHGELYCGYEVHVHDDTCWNEEYLADCGMEEHEHSENCYSLAYTLMAEFAAAVELFPDEADYILLDFDEADGSELLDEEAYYRAYAAFYEENPDIWATTDALFTEAEAAYAEENPDGDIDAWMQDNGFWEAAEKFYWVVPTPDAVAEKTAQYEEAEEIELEFTVEEDGMMLYGAEEATTNLVDEIVPGGQGITFKLFDYSKNININPEYLEENNVAWDVEPEEPTTADAKSKYWRSIIPYFAFRGTAYGTASTIDTTGNYTVYGQQTNPTQNYVYDQDGYTVNHATVMSTLKNGFPVLDLSCHQEVTKEGETYKPNGTSATDLNNTISEDIRSLKYLFSEGDPSVRVYTPTNTILQKKGNHYWYASEYNAVDYVEKTSAGESINEFYVHTYPERNSTTAGYGDAFGDFLPFNYTGGTKINGTEYHIATADVNYWFGMTMEINFFQTKDGKIMIDGEEKEMIFEFSGDDDVWVFVDNVLVLDLGGTHGTVDGSINFATGDVLQYLSWSGANSEGEAKEKGSSTSFPTTLKKQFAAAKATPNGGWDESGEVFADYTKHTLKFFYLERGAAVANCKLDFYLPTLPAESLTVGKELEIDDKTANQNIGEHLQETLSYKFRILEADSKTNLFGDTEDKSFTVYTDQNCTEVKRQGELDKNGYFELKAGEYARFTDMFNKKHDGLGNGINYIVEELIPVELFDQYKGVAELKTAVRIKDESTGEEYMSYQTDVLNTKKSEFFVFRNLVNIDELSALQITKLKSDGSTGITDDQKFEMYVELGDSPLPVGTVYMIDGDSNSHSVERAGIIPLKVGQTAIITGILSGTEYEVYEVNGDEYYVSYTAVANCTAHADKEKGEEIHKDCAECCPSITPSVAKSEDVEGDHGLVSGELSLNSSVEITATNSTYDVEDTVDLILTKMVTGNMGDRSKAFTFTVEMKLPNQPDPAAVFLFEAPTLYSVGSADDLPIITDTNDIGSAPKNIISNITLKHGESYRIVGITKGATITITEDTAGYELKSVVYDGEGDAIKIAEGTYSVIVNDRDTEVIFTNDKTATIDTAVHLDYLPYILILTAVIPTMTLAVSRKRRRRED